MQSPEFDDLTLVDASEALRRHFEARNDRRARLLWVAVTLISLGFLIAALDEARGAASVIAGANLAALVGLALFRRGEIFRRNFATILLATLAVEILFGVLLPVEPGGSIGFAIAFGAPALLLLRLRPGETAALAALAVGAVYIRVVVAPVGVEGDEPVSLGAVVGVAIALAIAAVVGQSITQRQRQEFLVQWRLAASRERDRRRMRDELHDARTIQLAMLPAAPPAVPGLDVAGVCVPANEVGGDYFDYFSDGDGTLGVAIGDVAGHGMSSGLVLAGVRAGLHLLADDLARDPAAVLARLNRIVGGPGGQRLLMTLGLARFDPRAGRALWVAAGHPPPLRWDASAGVCESPATGHPPLGTRLPLTLETVTRPLAAGDVWLLVSDGAIEARDARQREFGDGVLARSFARLAASDESASAIVDGLLAELARFRGGEPQQDDLTLVVVRVPAA